MIWLTCFVTLYCKTNFVWGELVCKYQRKQKNCHSVSLLHHSVISFSKSNKLILRYMDPKKYLLMVWQNIFGVTIPIIGQNKNADHNETEYMYCVFSWTLRSQTSDFVLARTSVTSNRQVRIFILRKNVHRIKVPPRELLNFEKHKHCSPLNNSD